MSLHLLEQSVEALEVPGPNTAVSLKPCGGLRERLGLKPARAALRVAAVRNEAGALEHLEVLGDGRLGHPEGLGQFQDRSFARSKARENGPASGVGKSGEGGIEAIGWIHYITCRLCNHMVIYETGRHLSSPSFLTKRPGIHFR